MDHDANRKVIDYSMKDPTTMKPESSIVNLEIETNQASS